MFQAADQIHSTSQAMSNYELASLIIAGLALLVSGIAFWRTNASQWGVFEIGLRAHIRDPHRRMLDLGTNNGVLLSKPDESLSADERIQKELIRAAVLAATEEYINAYEDVCAKYLDKKVDRKRFHKTYCTEIKQLVEDKKFDSHFHPTTTRYKAIMRVYREWEDHER